MQSRRRLPSLHSIGRSRCVDLDELPSEPAWLSDEDDEDASASLSSRLLGNNRPVLNQSKFDAFRSLNGNDVKNAPIVSQVDRRIEFPVTNEPNEVIVDDDCGEPEVTVEDELTDGSIFDNAELISRTLRSRFRVALGSAGQSYLCPKVVTSPGQDTGFRHVTRSAQLALGLRDIDRLLAIRARLQFVRQVSLQIRSAATFVSELRQLLDDECRTWYGVVRNDTDGRPPSTCLEQLHLLVDELRIHLGRWSAVRRQLMDYRRLCRRLFGQPCQPTSSADSMTVMEDAVWLRLADLGEAAFVLTHRLVTVGFRNLAHCDLERIGQDTLWNVARGLEQFNALVSSTDWCRHRSHSTLSVSSWSTMNRLPTDPVSVTSVLQLVASERSKYAAASIREHFVDHDEFLQLLARCRVPTPSWQRFLDHACAPSRVCVQKPDSTSGESRSTTTNGIEMFCDGDYINVPDLVGLPSPLIDFSRRESTFAARFIEVICRSTSLIQFASACESDATQSDPVAAVPDAVRSDESSVDLNASSDSDTRSPFATGSRKTVSWGDATLAVAAKQAMKYYLYAIWRRFAEHLFEFLITTEWLASKDRRSSKDRFDGILLCPKTTALVLLSMIQRCSSDEKYPLYSRRALSDVSLRLLTLVAWSASDAAFSGALACCSSSLGARTLSAVSLNGERYATLNCRLLRDAVLPLRAIVQLTNSFIAVAEAQNIRDTEASAVLDADSTAVIRILYPSVHRLLAICNTSTSWYSQKVQHLLSSRAVESYLLVSLEDLQILTEEYRNILSTCSSKTSTSDALVANLWCSLNLSVERLQLLTSGFRKQFYQMFSAAARDFFLQEMPTGKDWRRKNGDVCPVQHSDYIERAMECLMQPLITATSRFKPEAQLLALSTAISGLCEAWTTSVLSLKIRFSYLGACQLEFDVLYMRTWLDSYITDAAVRASVTSHDALNYMDGITSLLKQQPTVSSSGSKATVEQQKQKIAKNNNDRSRDQEVNSKLAADRYKLVSNITCEAKINDDDIVEIPWRQIPYRDQWLALRVHGGTRTWSRLTSCFNNTDT